MINGRESFFCNGRPFWLRTVISFRVIVVLMGNSMLTCLRQFCVALLLYSVTLSFGATSKAIAPTGSIPRTFFGLHIHRAIGKTPWPTMSVPTVRLWDAHVASQIWSLRKDDGSSMHSTST